jgi:hypothetical protein
MNLAEPFVNSSLEEIQVALDGGSLVLYSVARPTGPDRKVDRSAVLATFTFASPAFVPARSEGASDPVFAVNPLPATGTGTPGFARAFTADGAPVADFSADPGNTEVKLSEVSTTSGYPVTLTRLILSTASALTQNAAHG